MTDIPTQLASVADGMDTSAGVLTDIADSLSNDAEVLRTAVAQWDPNSTIAQLQEDLAATQAQVVELQSELAAAATDLIEVTAERDAALNEVSNLEARVAALTVELADCQAGNSDAAGLEVLPSGETLISGPVGLTPGPLAHLDLEGAQYSGAGGAFRGPDGSARWINVGHNAVIRAIDSETVEIELDAHVADSGAATSWHEASLFMGTADKEVWHEVDLFFVDDPVGGWPWAWPWTMKWGGLVWFDNTWDGDFPGGGKWGPRNCSNRVVWLRGPDGKGRPGSYLYLGTPGAERIRVAHGELASPPGDWTGSGHVMHFTADWEWPVNRWVRVREEMSVGSAGQDDGWCRLHVDEGGGWRCLLALEGIPFIELDDPGSLIRSSVTAMAGGSSSDYWPPNSRNAVKVRYRRMAAGRLA